MLQLSCGMILNVITVITIERRYLVGMVKKIMRITKRESDYSVVIDNMLGYNKKMERNFINFHELYWNKYKVLARTGTSVVKSNCIFFSALK